VTDLVDAFIDPSRLWTRAEVLTSPSPVPAVGGVYGWWFRKLPAVIDTSGCIKRDGLTLLYVGISPQPPPLNGRAPSTQNLRIRLRAHYAGNAEASTLRKSLGCLLADDLGIQLRRVGTGKRLTFLEGEQTLSGWMAENALVSWVTHDRPWELEDELIATLDLPLNLDGNSRHPYRAYLSALRSSAARNAESLPVVPNPGVAGRYVETPIDAGGRFAARLIPVEPLERSAPLARLVLAGAAARSDRRSVNDSRFMLAAALEALRRDNTTVGILTTPAGFVDHKPSGTWSGREGWATRSEDFDHVAAMAASVARTLITPDIRDLADGVVDHLILGIDVWPAGYPGPYGEVALLYDVETDAIRPVTGKSYPNTGQQDVLIRNPDATNHVVQIGDERVAILVCHDLAAWSPRGNAVAKGARADVWQAMRESVTAARPTLAVQLPHTVDNPRTWTAAWSAFGRDAGPGLKGGTTAIRHLNRWYDPVPGPVAASLLAGTGWGQRVLDVVVAGRIELAVILPTAGPPRVRTGAPAARQGPRATRVVIEDSERGVGLARVAMEVFAPRAAAYPQGITIGELANELRMAGRPIHGGDPQMTLRSALNNSQVHGVWRRRNGGLWVAGDGNSKMLEGLAGRPLAEALYAFVQVAYPGHVFHYEKARVGLERTGVAVRGTGSTTRGALAAASDLFEHEPGRGGLWRWK